MPVYMLTKGNNSCNNRQNGRVIWGAIYLFLLSIWFTRSYAPEFDNCKSLLIGLYFTSVVNRKGGPTRLIACLLPWGYSLTCQMSAFMVNNYFLSQHASHSKSSFWFPRCTTNCLPA